MASLNRPRRRASAPRSAREAAGTSELAKPSCCFFNLGLTCSTQSRKASARLMPTPSDAADAQVRAAWLEARRVDLLPVPYRHLIFTCQLPRSRCGTSAQLRRLTGATREVGKQPRLLDGKKP